MKLKMKLKKNKETEKTVNRENSFYKGKKDKYYFQQFDTVKSFTKKFLLSNYGF